MNEPTGEMVELDFYFGNQDRRASLRRVVDYCRANGATLSGEILASESVGDEPYRFRSIYDRPVHTLRVSQAEFDAKLSGNDIDIVKVGVFGALGLSTTVPEIITYSCISSEASSSDSPPVAIVGEGWGFSTPGFEQQAKNAGQKCYKRFVDICASLDPPYAAILNEDSLACQQDLRSERGSRCFLNFFVSTRAYGPKLITTIENLYRGAYVEPIKSGLFISTSGVYNPLSCELAADRALMLSAEIAGILTTANLDTGVGNRSLQAGSYEP